MASTTIICTCLIIITWTLVAQPPRQAMAAVSEISVISPARSAVPDVILPPVSSPELAAAREPSPAPEVTASVGIPEKDQARIEEEKEEVVAPRNVALREEVVAPRNVALREEAVAPRNVALREEAVAARNDPSDASPTPVKPNPSYVAYYVYSELPPERKPADIVLESMKDIPIGTPVEEIKRAADAFGLDFNFMKTVAKIESDFDPKQRTGSYIGLFQLNKYEFNKYGSGEITNPRDNAVAAAYKFVTEATLFEWETHKKPTFSDLYLIHQQGWQGAAEHVAEPDRMAWKSMCATDEGREKGERWCKRAIWGNTLPAIKKVWKSVEKLPSGEFVSMWRQRVDHFYTRYSEAKAADTKQ